MLGPEFVSPELNWQGGVPQELILPSLESSGPYPNTLTSLIPIGSALYRDRSLDATSAWGVVLGFLKPQVLKPGFWVPRKLR